MTVKVRTFALAHGGAAVGEVVSEGPLCGKRAFVRDACPDEIVEAEVTKDEERFLEAKTVKIENASKNRIAPPCPFYGKCGGCNLQHLRIDAQRRSKEEMITSMLQKQGGITPKHGVHDASAGLPEYGYRRRILLHLASDGRIGFFQSGSRDVVDIDRCMLATDLINSQLAELRADRSVTRQHSGAILEEIDGKVQVVLMQRGAEHKRQDPDEVDEPVGHFSQVNAAGNAILIRTVLDWVPSGEVTDLYAGAGNFSLPLAEKGCRVEAVELDRALVAEGKRLAKERNLTIEFTQSSCEKFTRYSKLKPVIVLDPPRSGAKDVVKYFHRKNVERIVYVSCSLPTLVRDLRALRELGFTVEETRFVDMFPQTHHVETVTLLS